MTTDFADRHLNPTQERFPKLSPEWWLWHAGEAWNYLSFDNDESWLFRNESRMAAREYARRAD